MAHSPGAPSVPRAFGELTRTKISSTWLVESGSTSVGSWYTSPVEDKCGGLTSMIIFMFIEGDITGDILEAN